MRHSWLILPLLGGLLVACEPPSINDPRPPVNVRPDEGDAGPDRCDDDADCPFGQVCAAGVCGPPAPQDGDGGCLSDADCGADEVCALATGLCVPAASFPEVPETDDGPCEDGQTRFCGSKVGACEYGLERCEGGAWSGSCEGGVGPSDEVCDGQDNDCNGETDELFVLGAPCEDGKGVCRQTGTIVCAPDGLSTVCSAVGLDPTGRVELCGNELNDDCDDETDEGFDGLGLACSEGIGACERPGVVTCSADLTTTACSAVPGPPAPAELCGGDPDDDCDTVEEEGFEAVGDTCFAGVGACRVQGSVVCNAQRNGTACSAVPLPPGPAELCGDGIDNDCDPATDENVLFPTVGDACVFGVPPCTVPGTIACNASGLGVECVPDVAVGGTELCDGADNDNDSCIDEDFDVSASCSVGVGACRNTGSKICAADQQGTVCDAVPLDPNPLGELCGNGVNDDCDDETDEGYLGLGNACTVGVGVCQSRGNFVCTADRLGIECSATPGEPNPFGELCGNGINDDCDDETDEGFDVGAPCSVGQGVCRRNGFKVCAPDGRGTVCSATPGPPNPAGELCGNGLNDDCDDETDEGFPNLGQPCTNGLGVCERSGFIVCSADRTLEICDAVPGPPHPDGELCGNGANDDCDALTDEGYPELGNPCVNGLGECARPGTVVCSATLTATQCSALPGVPVQEACDDLDNDCNGTPDNGCDDDGDDFCDASLDFVGSVLCPLSSPTLLDCADTDPAIFPGAEEICFDGKDSNCDGNLNDGCNCDPAIDRDFDGVNECDDCNDTNGAVRPGATELCDGIDNNCVGGIDEGFDVDGDGFTKCGTLPGGGTALFAVDCNDSDSSVFPGACEICADAAGNDLACGDIGVKGNDVDEDCDGFLDENCAPCDNVDNDGDGLSECAGDCDDTEPTVAPGNEELCDGFDTDCNKNTTENCVVGDDCNHAPETDECQEGLLCVQSLGNGGNPTGEFTCTSLCNFSELGLGIGDGCAANQICGASLTPSANQHGCQVATDIGAGLSGADCGDDTDCRSGRCLNDPRTVGPPDEFCDDLCGSDAYCRNGTRCMNFNDTGHCWPVLSNQTLGFNQTCTLARSFECPSRTCIDFGVGDLRCTDLCCTNDDCAAGFHCGLEGRGSAGPIGGVETVPVCFPDDTGNGGRQAGAACTANAQCASEFCDANLGVCVDVCCNDATCPVGLSCVDTLVDVDLQNIAGQTFARVCVNQTPADPLEKLP